MKEIIFRREEWDELRGILAAGKSIFTTRLGDEKGKFIPGETVRAPWGDAVEIAAVRELRSVEEYDLRDGLMPEKRAKLEKAGAFDVVEIRAGKS